MRVIPGHTSIMENQIGDTDTDIEAEAEIQTAEGDIETATETGIGIGIATGHQEGNTRHTTLDQETTEIADVDITGGEVIVVIEGQIGWGNHMLETETGTAA